MGDQAWVRCLICHDEHKVPVASIEVYRHPGGRHHYVADCPKCGPFVDAVGPRNLADLTRLGVAVQVVA